MLFWDVGAVCKQTNKAISIISKASRFATFRGLEWRRFHLSVLCKWGQMRSLAWTAGVNLFISVALYLLLEMSLPLNAVRKIKINILLSFRRKITQSCKSGVFHLIFSLAASEFTQTRRRVASGQFLLVDEAEQSAHNGRLRFKVLWPQERCPTERRAFIRIADDASRNSSRNQQAAIWGRPSFINI